MGIEISLRNRLGSINDKNNAMPPKRAVGCLCHRSSLGWAIKPMRLESHIRHGVRNALNPKE